MPVTNYHTVNGRLIGETTDGVRTDYLTDALGNITATVDQSQNVLNTYRYKPYGGLLAKTGTAADPRFLWTGDTGSRTTGLGYAEQYNRARHYGSRQAGWTSVDPLWPREPRYTYAMNSPASWTDRTGLTPTAGCTCRVIWRKRECISAAILVPHGRGQYEYLSCPGNPFMTVATGSAPVCNIHCGGAISGCTGTQSIRIKVTQERTRTGDWILVSECKKVVDLNCNPGFDFGSIVRALLGEFPGGGTGTALADELVRVLANCNGEDRKVIPAPTTATCHKDRPSKSWQARIETEETFRCCRGRLGDPSRVVGPIDPKVERKTWSGKACA